MNALDMLPARMDTLEVRMDNLEGQIVQLRSEMAVEFSAVRRDLRAEMREQGDELRGDIRAGDEATRTLMRVLHEEVIDRLKTIQRG